MLFKSAQNSSLMSTLGPHQGSIQDCFAARSTERCGPQVAHPCYRVFAKENTFLHIYIRSDRDRHSGGRSIWPARGRGGALSINPGNPVKLY